MKLRVLRNGIETFSIELEDGQKYIIGRGKDCNIKLEKSSGISRQHAKVQQSEDGIWVITKLSSSFPLLHNDEPIDEVSLEGAEEFRIPPYLITFTSDKVASDVPDPIKRVVAEPINDNDDDDNFVNEDTAKHEVKGTPYLKFISNNGDIDYLRLEGNLWTAGTDRTCEIILDEAKASAQHFQIIQKSEGFYIKDLSLSVGTFLNGHKIEPAEVVPLNSGDLITVKEYHIQFELRDTEFSEKIKNIPLQMYNNPMIFANDAQDLGQHSAMPALQRVDGYGQGAVPLGHGELPSEQPNKLRKFLLIGLAVMVVGFLFMRNQEPKEEDLNKEVGVTFESLNPEKKKYIVDTYKLSQSLYHNAKFELSLVQLNKIHEILPSYRDSKELEKQCVLSRELLRETAQKEQERREREELRKRIDSIIDRCFAEYKGTMDITGASLCLEPAKEINPSDPRISELSSGIQFSIDEENRALAKRKAFEDRVQKGRDLYTRAVNFHKQKQYQSALEAFEQHLAAGFPDPQNLRDHSKRTVASIRKSIDNKKNWYLEQSRKKLSVRDWRGSILLAKQAQEADPYDFSVANYIHSIKTKLFKEMKHIYTESLIEERYGNLESAKTKWQEILKKDIPSSDYYKKSVRKLRQYGA